MMNKEALRLSLNKFLKMYFNACKEVYKEINFDQLTKIQFKYLMAIKKLEETTLTELANHCKISKPSMNEVIVKFEKSGLIEKKKCETDKRITKISLSEVGKTLATTNLLESQRAVKKMTETLSEEDIILLKDIFDKFGDDEE